VGAALECWAEEDNIGISKFAMLGNRVDIDETELLEFFSKDRTTDVIALYLEGVKEGREFFKIAEEASEKKKIAVLKGGRSEKGSEAVITHTRSLAGEYNVFKSVCKQAGLIPVESIRELYAISKGVAGLPEPKGKNTIILTSSGGSGILAADAAEDLDVNLMDLPEKGIERLKNNLPSECIISNPVDLTGSANAEMFDEAIKILARYKDVHCIVTIIGDPMPGIADVIKERFERLTIIPVMLGGGKEESEERKKLVEAGIPVFTTPESAMRALSAL
ncbi:MAG: CoA-binding protein, partial [Hadesarchaea archaeon]|nr:CoA-binding protein [Hadesarchaea archaeon]